MSKAPFPDHLRLGCEELDRDHEILWLIMRGILAASEKASPRKRMEGLALALAAYFDAHFDNEEEFMRSTGYPSLTAHTTEHDWMRCQIQNLTESIKSRDKQSHADVVLRLRLWLQNHVAETDRPLAEYLGGEVSNLQAHF